MLKIPETLPALRPHTQLVRRSKAYELNVIWSFPSSGTLEVPSGSDRGFAIPLFVDIGFSDYETLLHTAVWSSMYVNVYMLYTHVHIHTEIHIANSRSLTSRLVQGFRKYY